jgi:hypothetical protein
MAGLRLRGTAAVAAGLLTLGLAGCAGERFPVERVEAGDLVVDLTPVLLELEDIPLSGWVVEPSDDDDPTVDDETGGICTFDFTEIMTPEQLATERGADFSNEARMTLLQETVWAVPSADELVAAISEQLAACSGPYDGTSGDAAATVTSTPLELTMPGTTTSVCRLYSAVIDGQGPLPGALCLGASGDRFLGVMLTSIDASLSPTQEEYVALMAAATTKAFAG